MLNSRPIIHSILIMMLAFVMFELLTPQPDNAVQARSFQNNLTGVPASMAAVTPNCIGGAENGLVLDDGVFDGENGRGNVVTPMVTLFDMPGPDFQIQQICVCLTSLGPSSATFDLVIYDTAGPGGVPGNELARFGDYSVSSVGQFPSAWTWYDIPVNFAAPQGPLYIGVDLAKPTGLFVCGDATQPLIQTNKYLDDGWEEEDMMDYGIRVEGEIPTIDLVAEASCAGNDLQVTIGEGDGNFTINAASGNGLPLSGLTTGTHTLTGPDWWQDVTVQEGAGNEEVINLGSFNCGVAGMTLVPLESPLETTEWGDTALFNVVLNSVPEGSVTVSFDSSNPAEGVVITADLSFDNTNWNIPQTATISGVDDQIADGDVIYVITATTSSASDASYNSGFSGTLDVVNVDDDSPAVSILETELVTDENGGSQIFYVVLTTQPLDTVSVAISGLDTTEGELSTTNLSFTTENWSIAQTISVTGLDDGEVDGDITYTLTATTASASDPNYSTGLTDTVQVINYDNDNAALIVSPLELLVAEDEPGRQTFGVRLGSVPSDPVTVNLSYDRSQLVLNPTSLVFDANNWNINQIVHVDAIADGIDEPILPYPIGVSTSATNGFAALSQTVTAILFDSADTIIVHVPNFGLIKIETWQAQPVYQSPHEGVVYNRDGTEMWFPHDADGNGYDTYVVTDIRTYQGETWLSLWMGSNRWVWVRYDPARLSIVNPIDWSTQSEWVP